MATADFDVAEFSQESRYKSDENLFVRFFNEDVEDKEASAKAGRPIYKTREMCGIRVPGKQHENCYVARRYIARFPKHYQAFKARENTPEEGTPLSEWPQMASTQVKELAFFNIKTVEQLANVTDNIIGNFQGGVTLKRKAQEFLAAAENGVNAAALEKELAERDNTIEAMQKEMAELREMISLASKGTSALAESTPEDTHAAPPTKSRRRRKAASED